MRANRYQEAVKLAKAGAREAALDMFQEMIETNPANEMAWLWLVECLDAPEARMLALEACVRFNPNARRARAALNALRRRGQFYPRVSDFSPMIAVTGIDKESQSLPEAPSAPGDPFNLRLEPEDGLDIHLEPHENYDLTFTPESLTEDVWGLNDADPVFTVSPDTITPGEVAEREARVYDLLAYRTPDNHGGNPWEDIEQAGMRITRSPERVNRRMPSFSNLYGPTQEERVLSMTYTSLAVFVVMLLVVLLFGTGHMVY